MKKQKNQNSLPMLIATDIQWADVEPPRHKTKRPGTLFKILPVQLILLVLLSYACQAQPEKEQVYLHLDKYQCWSGDSIYFRGYINYRGFRSTLSTNLYVDLWTETGLLQYRGLFPIIDGVGIGNFKVPDSLPTGNYVLRAFTLQQTNFDTSRFFTVPIAVYNKDKPLKAVKKIRIPPVNAVTAIDLQNLQVMVRLYNEDRIAVFLNMDTDCDKRNFIVIHPITPDSGALAEVHLTPNRHDNYVLFKIDSSKEIENILVQEDSALICKSYLKLKQVNRDIKINADTFNTNVNGFNSWEVELPDTLQWVSSVSVTPADRSVSPPVNIYSLMDSRTENLRVPVNKLDTSLITFTGRVWRKYSKKLIKDKASRTISFTGIKDTAYVFLRNAAQDDAGRFKLDSLFFFGKIRMQFRVNKIEDGNNDNIRVKLEHYVPPAFDTLSYRNCWEDDSAILSVDTAYTKEERKKYNLSKVKTLKAVIVTHYKNPARELNERYTTGFLSEPMALSFDVRTETRYSNIADFLRMKFQNEFNGGYNAVDTPKDHNKEPIMFYLNGNLQPWWMICNVDFKTLAFVKGGSLAGFQETPFERFQMGKNVATRFTFEGKDTGLGIPVQHDPYVIAIYTRKGKDWRTMPTGVNAVEVKGYDELWKFGGDRITLYWNPIVVANKFRIRFYNNQGIRSFRVVIEGINNRGQLIHKEQILE